ncbi:DUF2637 domain-containing protein [Micromonospora sp. WMMA1998]|uniref:DUF2637 domain-containing protein n=1 Tax=Micromonospora sp. WMMA1998 TaxID=3015167 RepID=UPI00248BB589|nr:DUF2637 domain-containing protein [Micromonospora sp. WMMA1998]WBC17577.1 DUF2637 domain-containing protein [Micromonospora sp. WMMA1998]
MNPTAFAARASAALVALVAGYSSFSHIAHVALRYGERREVAYALPFAIDGLLIVATTAMLDDKRNGRRVRWSARVAFAFGVTASLAANVASAAPSAGARVVAAVPAVALLLAVEVLSRVGRPADEVAEVADLTPERVVAEVTPAPVAVSPALAVAAARPSPARVVAQVTPSARDKATPRPSRQSSADAIRDAAAKPGATPASVAAALGVSVRTAQRHWPRVAVATPTLAGVTA